ncbi:1967_t:CDS:2, partial [Scutellospora calospora]
ADNTDFTDESDYLDTDAYAYPSENIENDEAQLAQLGGRRNCFRRGYRRGYREGCRICGGDYEGRRFPRT